MKKLRPENYKHLLSVKSKIDDYVTNESIELDEREQSEKRFQAFERHSLGICNAISRALLRVLLSENQEDFEKNLKELQEYSEEEDFKAWFNVSNDRWLNLFELVGNEDNTGTTIKTSTVPTKTVSE